MRAAILYVLMIYMICLVPCTSVATDGPPKRIISLAPSLTREVYDLQAEGDLIGVTCYRPRIAESKQVVGSLTSLNFEMILSLNPDIILASKDSNRKMDIERLGALGMNVIVFDGCESFECMCRVFNDLGLVLGRARESQTIINDIRSRIYSIKSRLSRQKPLKVFWQIGSNPLVTANDKTFTGEFILLAGCTNIFGTVNVPYPRVNIEEVIMRNPDVIFVVTGMESDNFLDMWSNIDEINAVKEGRVYGLSADLVCQPTPGRFFTAFEKVVEYLYPGAL